MYSWCSHIPNFNWKCIFVIEILKGNQHYWIFYKFKGHNSVENYLTRPKIKLAGIFSRQIYSPNFIWKCPCIAKIMSKTQSTGMERGNTTIMPRPFHDIKIQIVGINNKIKSEFEVLICDFFLYKIQNYAITIIIMIIIMTCLTNLRTRNSLSRLECSDKTWHQQKQDRQVDKVIQSR